MPNQPPPPPNQPPAGGFGAPQPPQAPPPAQTPPPAGYGTPPAPPQQTPPPAPGYGQPQAGYGYPQTPPPGQPGYGFPQTPPGQPGYGFPQTPPPAPVPPAGGGNAKRNQLMIIGAAVVAIAVIVAGGFWLTSGDDSDEGGDQTTANGQQSPSGGGNDKPSGPGGSEKAQGNTASKTLVNVEQPKVPAGDFNTIGTHGSWVTDKVYAKSNVAKVVGYDLDKGTEKWSVPLPGHVCGASRHVSGNKTAILFEPTLPGANGAIVCSKVGVIDLDAGKLLWSTEAKSSTSGDKAVRFDEVTVSGQTVAAGGTSGGGAWNLTDGKVLWEPKTDGQGCYDMGYAGGEALAVMRKCGRIGNQTLHAQVLDPVSGAPKYSYKMSQGIEWAQIISTKPLVVTANVNRTAKNATGVSDIFVVDESGQLKTSIPLTSGNYDPKCNSTEVEVCTKIVVGNGKVYLPSIEHQGSSNSGGPRTNEILSFDLNTGKQTTDRADAGERYTMFPLRMDGSNIIAYKRPPYDKGGQVVSIDGKTMKETVLMVNPEDKETRRAETQFVPEAEFRYADGRLFIADNIISNSSISEIEKQYLFVSFTTHR
ncbi:PQQ-binding-like beta-propeller repeat protein [Streptomyces sp. NPDC051211]|uniref:outer membrane protein assembly factor BamB family protein n=1 Tax=Streptomyces sp. NPDC051211 TaxID=3154643 RepID=UPI00344CF05A